ncbi:zinc finger protein 358 [Biomphalaria pfeifferi]|uniref:Zinc finger protein 358 n=1 Tax=Biomphalaria pfeifferi TaxID=112525 RepID=A0AAD8CCJ3_BIOPF|nr:zinc finger protein 358 [Biomphalaria pfeifferi]
MPRNKLSHQYTKQKQKLIYSQQSSETSPGASDVSRSYMADIVHPPDNYKPYLNSDTFQCSFCGDVFPTRILYQKHLNSIHREEGSRLYRGHRHGRLRGHGLRDSHSRPDVRDMNSRPNIRDMHSMPHFRDMFSRPYLRNMLFRPDTTDILSRSDTTDIRSRLETRDMLSMPDPRDLLSIPNARDLLSIPNTRDFLSIPNARDLLSMPDSRDTLSRPDIKDMLSRPDARDVHSRPDARDVVSRPDARDVPPRPDARDMPPNPDARDVLSRPDARNVLSRPDAIDLLSRPDIADMHARLDRASNEFMDPNFLKAFPSYQALVGNIISCMLCPEVLPDLAALKAHLSHFHGASMPFTCSVCGKGYASSSGLKHHMHLHEGKTFMCPVCDSKFTQKSTMKTHLKGIHMSSQCPQCFQVLKIGPEYDSHMLNCVNS